MNIRTSVSCLKCGWSWFNHVAWPKLCPKCKNPNWWKPKKNQEPKQVGEPKPGNLKYPIHNLEVGQSVLLPWQSDRTGYPDATKNYSMGRAVRQEETRKGKKFVREPKARGLLVTRIK